MDSYILIVAHQADNIRIFRKEMVFEFVKSGYKIVVISQGANEQDYDFFRKSNIRYINVPFERTGKNFFKDQKYKKSLINIFREYKNTCYAVFTIAAKPNIYGSLAAKKVGLKCFPLISGLGSIFRGDGVKNKLARPLFGLLYKKALKSDQCVFVHNNDDLNYLLKHHIVKKHKTIVLNGSGVNTKVFSFEEMPNTPSFIFVGRIIADKGIIEYINACHLIQNEFKDIQCSIIGDFDNNPSKISSDLFFEQLKKTKITFFGHQDNVVPFLKEHAIFVLPSYHEGLPKSVIEAMSVGRPIITTNSPGCKETVIDNINGFLVPVRDVKALYNAMKWMIINYDKTSKMGLESRKMVEERFDSNIVNKLILETMGIKKGSAK